MHGLLKFHLAASLAILHAAALPSQQSEPQNRVPGRAEAESSRRPAPTASAFTQSAGVSILDGKLVGGGPDYAVQFGAAKVEFTPALSAAERLFPFTMSVTSYGRGVASQRASVGTLTHRSHTAFYDRDAFVESYEARLDGLKQSFTFEELPSGAGDLIVRVKIETDLRLQPEVGSDGELTFLHPGIGGVTIGKVVGIDGSGARITGSMQYEAGLLEMRLPESFVERAVMPVVLDPLVGPTFPATTGWDDSDFDIAYDASANTYLATWRRRFSTTNYGVRAQRINDSGGLHGGLIVIEGLTTSMAPRVANSSPENTFLVVYSNAGNILGRAVLASSGAVGNLATIRDTADNLSSPDVGGEAASDDELIVTWQNITTGEILAKQVNINGDVSPPICTPWTSVVLIGDAGPSFSNSSPRISNSGGSTGHHCIVWNRQFSWAPESAVRGALVTRNLGILHTVFSFTQPSGGDCDLPSVDGDGRNWVVAWEKENVPGSGDNDVQARAVAYDPNAPVLNQGYFASGIVYIEAGIADDERVANVTWMGDSVLIMHEDESTVANDYDVYAQPVDIYTCLDSAPRFTVDSSSGDQGPVRAASKATGGGTLDDALIVWSERSLTGGVGEGWAIRFRADDGVSTNLGGGCGSEGGITAACATVGNNGFRARLRGSIPSTSAWWVVSPYRLDFACGGCTLVPEPYSGFIISRTTDTRGDAFVAVSIPAAAALVGATFIHQWLIMDPSTAACGVFGSDLSDALRTQIQ